MVKEYLRIGVIDDHAVVREGIANILSRFGDMKIVFQGATADEAIRLTRENEPDLLLIDLGIPGSGLNALKVLRNELPEMVCVIFTSSDDPIVAMEALSIGINGYILKGIGGNDLHAALKAIVSGDSYISPEFATRLMGAAGVTARVRDPNSTLNRREEQIMLGVEKGMTNRQIAEELNLSEQTIKYYMTGIMQKYGVTNRVSAIREFQADPTRRGGPTRH